AAAMEGAKKADEARAPRDVAGELEGRLDRFRAALADEYLRRLTDRVEPDDPLAQARHALVIETVRDVEEVLARFPDCLHHLGVAMTGAADRDAGGEVEKAVAIDVPDFRAAAVRNDERVIPHQRGATDFPIALDQRARLGARQLGADVRSGKFGSEHK